MSEEITKGLRLVGFDFNPNGNPDVYSIKKKMAEVIDFLLTTQELTNDPVKSQLCTEAIGQCITAQMWAVKAVTFKE